MTLGVLTSSYPRFPDDTNNAGVFVRDFARAVAAGGIALCVFTHRKGMPGRYEEPFPVHEYRWLGRETSLTSVDLGSPVGWLKAASLMGAGAVSYLRACRSRRVSYSLAMWAVPSGVFAYAAKRAMGVPYAVWALGSDIWRYEKHRLMGPLLKRVLDGADRLYADGEELADQVSRICGRPCSFLPSTRDLSGVPPEAVTEDRPRPRFLFVGRWETNKGPDVLVEAAARYLERGGAGSFDLFGEGSMAASLRERIASHGIGGRVRLHGVIGAGGLVGRLAWCDYLVIPSRIESIPVIFSDALQRDVPVVATEVGDLGRLVKEWAVGLTAPPDDPDALAGAFLELETVDRASFAESVRRAARHFALGEIAERFLRDAGLRAHP